MTTKSKIDDGFYPELVEGACRVGYMGIPKLMDLHNTEIPSSLIPFSQAKRELDRGNTHAYIHFYQFDDTFSQIITDIDSYIELLHCFDGAIAPDCSMLDGQSNCLQATNTYFNRAVGYRLQKAGIPVICNIRWSNEASFDYCFLGAPKKSIVAVSTYGTIRSRKNQLDFRVGLLAMLEELAPSDVIVYGAMPDVTFGGLERRTRFHHFDDWIKAAHVQGGGVNGTRLS